MTILNEAYRTMVFAMFSILNIFFKRRSRCFAAAAAAKSLQSCPTLCDPIDGLPPGSPIPGLHSLVKTPSVSKYDNSTLLCKTLRTVPGSKFSAMVSCWHLPHGLVGRECKLSSSIPASFSNQNLWLPSLPES